MLGEKADESSSHNGMKKTIWRQQSAHRRAFASHALEEMIYLVPSRSAKDSIVPKVRFSVPLIAVPAAFLQPLLVRPNCEGFEIVAGQRGFHALTKLAEEGIAEPVRHHGGPR